MPAQRRYGMDHEHYDWSPMVTRPAVRWPNDARVALCVIVNLEHMEWSPPEGSYSRANLAGGFGDRPFPDYTRKSHREYGHRVGIFRVLDALEANEIRPTIAVDLLTAENYPYLVRHCMSRGCEIIAHGVSVSRMITSEMSEQEEREYIRQSVEGLKRATGVAPLGWLGPEYGESARTPQLLAEAGIRFVCDWTNDEQPYPMKTPEGQIYAFSISLELDDVGALWERHIDIERYSELLKESFDVLCQDGQTSGRLMVLNLHPWLIGQPFRIGYLEEALEHMMGQEDVWAASGSEILNWYQSNRPGDEA